MEEADLPWMGDRRIVKRHAVPDVPLTLSYRHRGVFRSRSTASLCAVLTDISAIGAQIVARPSKHLVVQSVVEIELAGDHGRAIVRDIRPMDGMQVRYGLEFVEMHPRFRTRILALADRARTGANRSAQVPDTCSAITAAAPETPP